MANIQMSPGSNGADPLNNYDTIIRLLPTGAGQEGNIDVEGAEARADL
jgi:hypothetical protein